MSVAAGFALIALGCWAAFTTAQTLVSPDGWTAHRTVALAGIAFVASCFLPGVSLLVGTFAPWTLIPLGVCYVVLIPLPCYFGWANRGAVRAARAVLFFSIGAALVSAGLGWLPLGWLGS